MKTLTTFIKTMRMLIFMIGILTPVVSTAQNPKPEFTPNTAGEYCIPFSDCSYGDGFEIFVLEEIVNVDSGCSPDGYGDFTAMQTSLTADEQYLIDVVCLYGENNMSVWIDFNDDDEFAPDEMLVDDFFLEIGGAVYEIPIAIPSDALSGFHRLRARACYFMESASDPCADFVDGETEDYTVEIIGGGGFTDIGIVSIDIPELLFPGSVNIKVTLQNFGDETFTQQVSIINGVGYGTSAIVPDILPGEVRQISFAPWEAELGNYTWYAYFSYQDDNSENNDLIKEVEVISPNSVESPQNLAGQTDGNSVILSWDPLNANGVLGYRLYSNGIRIADSLEQTSFTDLCLSSGNFIYTVTAIYEMGESLPGEPLDLTIQNCNLPCFEEGFEAFTAGQHLVVQAENMDLDYWHCWSQQAASVEDPYITDEVVFEGQNAMVIQELNDVVLELGGKTEGKWEVGFNIYIPAGFDGFFGIWREFSSYSWGLEVYFDANETGASKVANSDWEWFTYPIDTWNTIVASIDLDNDWAKMYINGQMIAQAQWSLGESGEPGPKKLDGIDFYAGTLWEGVPKSFVDNISFQRIIDDPLPPENLMAEVNQNNVTLSWDAPMEGMIGYIITRDDEPIGSASSLTFLDENLESGEYSYTVTALYEGCASLPTDPVIATIYPSQVINIPQGWSGLSGCIEPTNSDIENIFQAFVGDLIILQSENGMYWPGQNINTLFNWDAHCAYKIKTSESISLTLCGPSPANKTISLLEGWNLIPVLSACDVDIADLFAGQDLILVKEIAGSKVYWPNFGIQSLQSLESGKAYFVLMETEGSIEFLECARTPSNSPLRGRTGQRTGVGLCAATPISHTIAIPAKVVDENLKGKFLGAFGENNICYGYTLLSGKNDALTLFGDDATTIGKDGFLENEKPTFKIWDEQGSEAMIIDVVFDKSLPQYEGAFVANGISVIQKLKTAPSSVENPDKIKIKIFPNPASDFVTIQFESGNDEPFEIILADMQGRETKHLQTHGNSFRLNISEAPRGIYFLKIIRAGKSHTEKLIIE